MNKNLHIYRVGDNVIEKNSGNHGYVLTVLDVKSKLYELDDIQMHIFIAEVKSRYGEDISKWQNLLVQFGKSAPRWVESINVKPTGILKLN